MAETDSPLDVFKRALTAASRAISSEAEINIAFGSDLPTMQGKTIRLPLPSRGLPSQSALKVRGAADSFSLHHRYHDEQVHKALRPTYC